MGQCNNSQLQPWHPAWDYQAAVFLTNGNGNWQKCKAALPTAPKSNPLAQYQQQLAMLTPVVATQPISAGTRKYTQRSNTYRQLTHKQYSLQQAAMKLNLTKHWPLASNVEGDG